MNFPIGNLTSKKTDGLLNEFIGYEPLYVGTDKIWCFLEMNSEQDVINHVPNLSLLKKHIQKAFVITAKSSRPDIDFVSRFFGPDVGIDEDPVTGSAHCYLAKYWSEKLDKTILKAQQVSARRGEIECELTDNNRVLLRGEAVIMSEVIFEY